MTTQKLSRCIEKLKEQEVHQPVIDLFTNFYEAYTKDNLSKIPWNDIQPLNPTDLKDLDDLNEFEAPGAEALRKCAILKLNGGLGTSMGCSLPKSLIKVTAEKTFLDIILDQVHHVRDTYGVDLPLLLMNSYSTYAQTEQRIAGLDNVFGFMQHRFPRISVKTKTPFVSYKNPDLEWYPPGHGDVFFALDRSGFLDDLLALDYDYLFISNSDNLGATINLPILGYLAKNKYDFLIESTPKTALDVKGGTFVHYKDKLTLLERAQVPESHMKEFENTSQFPIFNTNSIWLNLKKLKENLRTGKLNLPPIVNPKTVEGQDIVQLESAMGAAVSAFDHSRVIVVDRRRFMPVKKTSDLLLMKSDLFIKHTDGTLTRNPERRSATLPNITLAPPLDTTDGFESHFKSIPSLLHLDSLHVEGEVIFGEKVSLEGDVSIRHNEEHPLLIEDQLIS